ncbi:MAG: hypothetical protein OJF47_000873 [Nitrospira sp.]|nr:MAG: hypothetical protein OJF47_000873 [Nitrospira sp.]
MEQKEALYDEAKGAQIRRPIMALRLFGQSIWLDGVERRSLDSGAFKRSIFEEGVSGATANPAAFAKAVRGGADDVEALNAFTREPSLDAKARYERLAIEDIQTAADLLQPVYARTKRRDGYVSWEVSPYLAQDTSGILEEARRLWDVVGRDNLMMTVPATQEGLSAIEQLLSEGININATLIFSQETYARVVEAFLLGLERLAARGVDVGSVASVASVFVGRLEAAADRELSAYLATSMSESERSLYRSLRGKIAVAIATLIYQQYRVLFSGPRWDALARLGAMSQRVLWVGTDTNDFRCHDEPYVEAIIAPETVTMVPPMTVRACRGRVNRLNNGLDDVKAVLHAFAQTGVSLKKIADRLLEKELQVDRNAFDKLLATVEPQSDADESIPQMQPSKRRLR